MPTVVPRPGTQHGRRRRDKAKPIVPRIIDRRSFGNRVSEQGLIQDLGLYSDVRKDFTRQHGGMISVGELTKQVPYEVFVRSPRRSGLAKVLICMGATVRTECARGLSVTGMDACSIASAAAAHYIPIQELTRRSVYWQA